MAVLNPLNLSRISVVNRSVSYPHRLVLCILVGTASGLTWPSRDAALDAEVRGRVFLLSLLLTKHQN